MLLVEQLPHRPAPHPRGHHRLVRDLVDGREADPERAGRVLPRAFRAALNPPEAVKVTERVPALRPRTILRRQLRPIAIGEDAVIADEQPVVAGV